MADFGVFDTKTVLHAPVVFLNTPFVLLHTPDHMGFRKVVENPSMKLTATFFDGERRN